MSRPPKFRLDWRQAEEARRMRREGLSWNAVARALGLRCAAPCMTLRAAVARAPRPPAGESAPGTREAAVREAERDPVLSRRCAKCGRQNYTLSAQSSGMVVPMAVGFTRLGGRWLCPDCAPRPRPTPEQALWGEAPVTYGPPA